MNQKSLPREQFLQAGYRLLGEMDTTDLARSLSISAVVERAGLSHQTFHNTYPGNSRGGGSGGKEAFVEDLLDHLTLEYTGTAAPAGTQDVKGPVSALFDDLTSGLMRRRLVAVLLAADHNGAQKAVIPEFERFDTDLRSIIGRAVQAHGGSLRQPLSLTNLSAVVGALLDGLALREVLTPGSVSSDDVASATNSILQWAIDPLHSDRTVAQPDPGEISDALRPDLEADVIAATETLFVDNGYFLVTLADIAAAAKIRVEDLRRLFPSKVDIIVAALKPEFDRVLRLRRADERLGVDPGEGELWATMLDAKVTRLPPVTAL